MPAKYCDLDPIPSQVLKDLAHYLGQRTYQAGECIINAWSICKGVEVSYPETIAQENRNGHLQQQVIQTCE